MQLSGRHTCRTYEDQPMGRLFLFAQQRASVIGVKIFANPPKEQDKLEGYRTPPPPQKKLGHVILSGTPQLFFGSLEAKLVLDFDDDAMIVPDLQATAPKETHAPGILFIGKGKTYLSVKYETMHDHTIGHIDIATGEFERHLHMNVELAVANWRVVLAKPLAGIDLVKYGPAA